MLPLRSHAVLLLALLGGVAISLTAWRQVEKNHAERVEQIFRHLAETRAGMLQTTVDEHVEILRSTAAFFEASNQVNRDEFRLFTAPFLHRHQEIVAIQWLPRVEHAQRARFEADARADGLVGYRILDINGHGTVPAATRARYFPICYAESLNLRTPFGLDPYSRQSNAEAMTTAWETGRIAMSAPFTLAQDDARRIQAIVLYLPVYKSGIQVTDPRQRQKHLLGFVNLIMEGEKLGMTAFHKDHSGELLFVLKDASPGGGVLYNNHARLSGTASSPEPMLTYRQKIQIPDREWYFEVGATPAFIKNHGLVSHSRLLLAGGLFSTGLLSLLLFVTQRNATRMAKLAAEAEAASRAKTAFLANTSHEIRTPMNAVIGMTELALASRLDTRQRDYVEKAHSAAVSLLGVLNDILDFSKIEAGKLQLDHAPFDLPKLLEQVRGMLAISAQKKGLELRCDCDPGIPPCLLGDSLRLKQVLTNLLSNAVKFTSQGSVTLTIAIDRAIAIDHAVDTDTGLQLRFTVRDTGIGMSTAHLEGLFQPFSQVDSSITRKFGGSGLGLAISKQLVHLMGGEIDVESTPGVGSAFSFAVRFERCGDMAIRDLVDEPAADDSLRGMRVLFAEDNVVNQQLVVELLSRVGAEVTVVPDGSEAVAHLENSFDPAFDLVLMDIQMPIMDGYTAARLIRGNPRFSDLPIVALTAHAMADERQNCLDVGMQDYLSKPIDTRHFYATLARWRPGIQLAAIRPELQQPEGMSSLTDVPDGAAPLLAIPCLDNARQALQLMGDDVALYRQMIDMFLADQGDAVERIRAALSEGDLAGAHRIAHSLKGLAASIGATSLHEAALTLEKALKVQDVRDVEALVGIVEARLASLLPSLRALPAAD